MKKDRISEAIETGIASIVPMSSAIGAGAGHVAGATIGSLGGPGGIILGQKVGTALGGVIGTAAGHAVASGATKLHHKHGHHISEERIREAMMRRGMKPAHERKLVRIK